MDLPTYEPPAEPDRTPRPNPIIDTPATVDACTRDYENAARVRAELDKQQRN
ncbi:hypothetical protein [Streptomyces cinereoruber]|uniref:hypothetical protein n=1 Tax=Streptomyces cinereoruber TaxID=67260 RepID=UPI00339633FE